MTENIPEYKLKQMKIRDVAYTSKWYELAYNERYEYEQVNYSVIIVIKNKES